MYPQPCVLLSEVWSLQSPIHSPTPEMFLSQSQLQTAGFALIQGFIFGFVNPRKIVSSGSSNRNEKDRLMKQILVFGMIVFLAFGCQQEPAKPAEKDPLPHSFEKSYIDTHNGYSEAVVITSGNLKTIYISGQVGEGADLETQMRDALSKMELLLTRQGAQITDVIKMNTYIVDYGPQSLEVFRGVRKELLGDTNMPASTLVGVAALALPEWLIEIEAVAVVPVR